MCSICAWIIDWVNDREAGDLGRHRGHFDVIVMDYGAFCQINPLVAGGSIIKGH